MMGQLYEEYLSSNEDWMASSLVVNAERKLSSRRRGKFRMVMMKDLRTQYGSAIAKSLRDDKKSQEQKKSPNDSIVYWSEHPDLPGKEDWTLDKPLKNWAGYRLVQGFFYRKIHCLFDMI